MTALEIEIAVAKYFGVRRNIIVPNVSWGMNLHECDLLILSKAGYATEVEIKISKHDLIKDKKKKHQHISFKIKNLYFAIPEYLQDSIEHIPEVAGIIIVPVDKRRRCFILRQSKIKGDGKCTEKEMFHLARLGTMRIFGLKEKIRKLQERSK